MKTYWVFWTYVANFGAHPFRVKADNIVAAMKEATMYDPYREEDGKRIRFIVFEEGGSLVWDGPAPKVEDSPGNVVTGESMMPGRPAILGVDSEHENDLDWLYEVHIALDTEHKLPDHMVPVHERVKWACLVGNEDAPDAIYLSTKSQPDTTDPLYRFK